MKHTSQALVAAAFALAATLLPGCGSSTGSSASGADTVRLNLQGKGVETSIYVELSSDDNPLLQAAVREYVSETLGGTYEGAYDSADSIVAYYGQEMKKKMETVYKENPTGGHFTYRNSYEIKKSVDTTAYVTYLAYYDEFTGGAHGSYTLFGTTFRKSDGRRFGWEMLHDTQDETFHQLLKSGLRDYFAAGDCDVDTDEKLKMMIFVDADIDYLPLPQAVPYLSKEGVTFIYQCYEIAPYAAGTPTFTVPWDKISPYLTATVKKLVSPDPKIEIK